MEENKTEKPTITVEEAQAIVEAAAKEKEAKAVKIYEEAIKEISELGYSVVPQGSFVGEKFNLAISLMKNN